MIIWLASYPRSGNTFFRILLHHVYGLATQAVYPEFPPPEIAQILGSPGGAVDLAAARDADEPRFVKTHDLPGDDSFPAIYLVRDGRDALVSYARFILTYEHAGDHDHQAFVDTLQALVVEDASFGGWGNNVASWTHRPATTLVRFEHLIVEPLRELERVLAAIGQRVPPPRNPTPTFAELKERLPHFFTTGRVGTWRDQMPTDLEHVFWRKNGRIMQELGYERASVERPQYQRCASPGSTRPGQ